MNGRRSNRLFEQGSGKADITPTGNWFPGDEWKGDVARMIMYMELRYPDQTLANEVGVGTHVFHADMPDIFLDWNVQDPVSELEIKRNDYLETIQGNRNPFIDNPYLATLIWSGELAEDKWNLLSVEEVAEEVLALEVYPNPTSDMVYFANFDNPTSILVMDAQGRVVGQDKNLKDNEVNLPAQSGGYWILFKNDLTTLTRKVVVK